METKKREIKRIFIAIIFILSILFTQQKLSAVSLKEQWTLQFGTDQNDGAGSTIMTDDGGYIAVGTTDGSIGQSTSFGKIDGLIIKFSSDGNLQWSKQYGGSENDYLSSIVKTSDGGYIVAGDTKGVVGGGSSHGTFDGWLLKISSNGTEQWSKQYGTSAEDLFRDVIQTSDGGYIAVGYFDSTYGATDGWILKTDANGVQEFSKWYGNAQYEFLSFIEQTSDGGYIAAGQSYQSSQYDGWLLKIDDLGMVEWSNYYGGNQNDSFGSVIQLSSNSYVVSGYTNSSINGNTHFGMSDALFIKLNLAYDLSFDLNGKLGTAPTTQSIEEGLLATKPDSPQADNFVFTGWNTQADGAGIEWDFNTTTMPANNVVLYAQWKEAFKLEFNLNGGGGVQPQSQTLIEGALATKVTAPTRNGYIFKGWNTKSDASGINWDFNVSTMPANNVMLYAIWEIKNEYYLNFDLNGGNGTAPQKQILYKGDKAKEPASPKRAGYTFKGWNTKKSGNGQMWNFNKTIMPAANVILYAQWEENIIPKTGYSGDVIIISSLLLSFASIIGFVNKRKFIK